MYVIHCTREQGAANNSLSSYKLVGSCGCVNLLLLATKRSQSLTHGRGFMLPGAVILLRSWLAVVAASALHPLSDGEAMARQAEETKYTYIYRGIYRWI